RASTRTPMRSVPIDHGSPSNRSPVTPPTGRPVDPAAPLPLPTRERSLTGRVEITSARSGSVSVPPGEIGAGSPRDRDADADPRSEEYRSLFVEFVKLRRTTGESVEGLEVRQFVQTLRQKRAQIMKQSPVKDVRFKLAFQNGKAAIRYLTIT